MEPTQPGRPEYLYSYLISSPYEDTVKTDGYGIPVAPPPPPVLPKRNWWKIVAIVEIAVILLVTSFAGYIVIQKVPTPKKVNVVSTSVPTQQPVVSYTALTVLDAIIANVNRTGASSAKVNDNWQCCSYSPTRGAYIWCDSCSDGPGAAYYVDIAVFSSNFQALKDENELIGNGYSTDVVNNCLLSYDVELTGSYIIDQYIQVMRSVCKQP